MRRDVGGEALHVAQLHLDGLRMVVRAEGRVGGELNGFLLRGRELLERREHRVALEVAGELDLVRVVDGLGVVEVEALDEELARGLLAFLTVGGGEILLRRGLVLKPHVVVRELGVILKALHPEEAQRAHNGRRHVALKGGEFAQLERGPRHDDGHGGGDEHEGVEGADGDADHAVRPEVRADAQKDVGGEEAAEEHHFGREEQPDAELRVVKPRVRTGFDCVGDFHFRGWGKCDGK